MSAARTAALGGVTTVRDLGDRGFPDACDARHAWASDNRVRRPAAHHTGRALPLPRRREERGADAVRRAVRTHAELGVDVIKVMASGGLLTPGTRETESQFTPVELRAIVDEAHQLGLPVTAHAHGTPAIVDALAADIDGLEHATFWTEDGHRQP